MMNLIPKTNFDFLKNRKVFFALTAVVMAACLFLIFFKGFNFGIDFKGGAMVQVKFNQKTEIGSVRDAVGGMNAEVQSISNRNAFTIKVKGAQENVNEIRDNVASKLTAAGLNYEIEQTDFVGPTVGKDLTTRAIKALFWSLVFMVLYIAFRFSNIAWGTTAVLSLFHDVILIAGIFVVIRAEFDLVTVAALLTSVGYSINDNIVIFDRMREVMRENPKMRFYEVINKSVNETLSRTVITGLTVLISVTILYFFGGEALKNFSLIMILGVFIGTYSTIFIACPLLYQWIGAREDDPQAAVRKEIKTVKAQVKAEVAQQEQLAQHHAPKKRKYKRK